MSKRKQSSESRKGVKRKESEERKELPPLTKSALRYISSSCKEYFLEHQDEWRLEYQINLMNLPFQQLLDNFEEVYLDFMSSYYDRLSTMFTIPQVENSDFDMDDEDDQKYAKAECITRVLNETNPSYFHPIFVAQKRFIELRNLGSEKKDIDWDNPMTDLNLNIEEVAMFFNIFIAGMLRHLKAN